MMARQGEVIPPKGIWTPKKAQTNEMHEQTSVFISKSIEPSPPLAQLRVYHSQFRESFFSVVYKKKFAVCYCFDLIDMPASEAETHY